MRYDFAPLAQLMGLSENAAMKQLGVAGSTAQEYRERGLSEKVADRLAVKAGFVPYEVWPQMLEDQMERAEAEERAKNAARQRRYRQRYPEAAEAHRRQVAKHYAETRGYVLARRRAYYAANRERLAAEARERRARKKAA